MNRIACCFFHETSEKSFRTHGNQRESTDPVKQAPHGASVRYRLCNHSGGSDGSLGRIDRGHDVGVGGGVQVKRARDTGHLAG